MQNMDRLRHFIGNMYPCAVLKKVCVQRDECILLVWRMMPEIFLNQWVSQAIGKRSYRHTCPCLRQIGKFGGIASVDKNQPDRTGNQKFLDIAQG